MSHINRVAIFIDGQSLNSSAKQLRIDIDYKRLRSLYDAKGLAGVLFYIVLDDDQEYSSLRPLVDWLAYNGYRTVTKSSREASDANGRRRGKTNINVDLAVSAIEMAPQLDHIVLFAGDGNYRAMVEAVQRKGVRVTVVSTIATQPPIVADELRRQADEFIDLANLAPHIGRPTTERATSAEARKIDDSAERREAHIGSPTAPE